MFKANLNDSQRDLVINSLHGESLQELLRQSISSLDLAALESFERCGVFEDLRPRNERPVPCLPRDRALLLPEAAPTIDSLGALYSLTAFVQVEPKRPHCLQLDVPAPVRDLLSRHLRKALDGLVEDGSRPHADMAAIAASAVALDDAALFERVAELQPFALLQPLGEPVSKSLRLGEATAWSAAFTLARVDMIERALPRLPSVKVTSITLDRTIAHSTEQAGYLASELVPDASPRHRALAKLILRTVDPDQPPGLRRAALAITAQLVGSGAQDWTSLLPWACAEVPDLVRPHLHQMIEGLCGLNESELTLAETDNVAHVMRTADWDNFLRFFSMAAANPEEKFRLPQEHPLSAALHLHPSAVDIALRVAQEHNQLDDLLLPNVYICDVLPVPLELSKQGCLHGLRHVLDAGFDVTAPCVGGQSLIELCDEDDFDPDCSALIRSVGAMQSIERSLAQTSSLSASPAFEVAP